MRKTNRKLTLQRQTLRTLSGDALQQAAGGAEIGQIIVIKASWNCPRTWNCDARFSGFQNSCPSIIPPCQGGDETFKPISG